jgi:hypothetical protein
MGAALTPLSNRQLLIWINARNQFEGSTRNNFPRSLGSEDKQALSGSLALAGNEPFGAKVDKILRMVRERLRESCRSNDTGE